MTKNFFRFLNWQNFFSTKTIFLWFLFILFIASFLRLAWLSQGPLVGDEPLYSVRSMGWVDSLGSDLQTTPWDWFYPAPVWTKLSFHDHPPLVFAIQHLFFDLLNSDSLLVARLPSAIFGIFTVGLVFFLVKQLFKNEKLALLAMGIFAINNFLVFYSRLSMMESITLFFILLAIYLLSLALDNKKYLPWFGVVCGLAFLAKYVAIILLPLALIIILFYRREYFKDHRLYLAVGLALLVFSPVLIYNYQMYRSVGHFDLQLAYLLKQTTPEWQVLPGKEEIQDFFGSLKGLVGTVYFLSPALIVFFFSGFCFSVYLIFKRKEDRQSMIILLASLLLSWLLLFFVGTASRFLFYTVPFICLIAVMFVFVVFFNKQVGRIGKILFIILAIYELLFSINTNIINRWHDRPIGLEYIAFANPFIVKDYGITRLNNYLDAELSGKRSKLLGTGSNKNSNDLIAKNDKKPLDGGISPEAVIIVYDHRVEANIINWVFYKRMIYQGWPLFTIQSFRFFGNKEMPDFAIDKNTNYYYILATENTALNKKIDINSSIFTLLQDALEKIGVAPVLILNNEGETAFYIYKFNGETMVKLFDKKSSTDADDGVI